MHTTKSRENQYGQKEIVDEIPKISCCVATVITFITTITKMHFKKTRRELVSECGAKL
jgi:hypothetical protein